jgi:signal transduction histidine kinase
MRLKMVISQKCSVVLYLGGALYFWSVALLAAEPTSIAMAIDGKSVDLTGTPVTVRPDQKILFTVGDQTPLTHDDSTPTIDSKEGRIRYRMEGFDTDWHQQDGEMSFSVEFFNRIGDQVGEKSYKARGKSSGWNGTLEQSTFTHRREVIVVPPGAEYLNVDISSAGPPSSVGIYVVDEVLVARPRPEGGRPQTVLDSQPFTAPGKNPNQTGPTWKTEGTRPSMATLISFHGSEFSSKAFCIIDDDKTAHAEWRSTAENAPQVMPGETLTVEWNEIYENSVGDQTFASYGPLPMGQYRFVVQEVDVLDRPLNITKSIDVLVPLPFWKNPWTWVGGIFLLGGLSIAGSRWAMRANFRRQLDRTRLVEQERLRIARDLHDELGARLAHISLISAYAESKASSDEASSSFHEISGISRELGSALSEVVWMVNPENDHLESLVSFLFRLIHGLCEPARIRCRLDALGIIDERPVPSALRHETSLAVKEAVNNILKHSGATEVEASIRFHAPLLKISISDNGKGFDQGKTPSGNGLANMRQRMATIHGTIAIDSVEGRGTTILFQVPIP